MANIHLRVIDVDYVVELRRELHRVPELDDRLPKTCGVVRRELMAMDLNPLEPFEGCIVARVGGGGGPAVAFRADMDALPVEERTGLPFRSLHEGRMHACGHDGHTAMLLGLARLLTEGWLRPPGDVLLIFQPSEETGGGAKRVLESGVLDGAGLRAVFGLHLWPDMPAGAAASCPGMIMAGSARLEAGFFGRSAHAASQQSGADAMAAAVRFLAEVYRRRGEDCGVVNVGRLICGSAENLVADRSQLFGTVRYLKRQQLERARELLKSAAAAAEEGGCRAQLQLKEGYPPLQNHPGLLQKAKKALGESLFPGAKPSFATEDFAFYSAAAPSLFIRLGTGMHRQLHSPDFDFDEKALPAGVKLLAALAELEL